MSLRLTPTMRPAYHAAVYGPLPGSGLPTTLPLVRIQRRLPHFERDGIVQPLVATYVVERLPGTAKRGTKFANGRCLYVGDSLDVAMEWASVQYPKGTALVHPTWPTAQVYDPWTKRTHHVTVERSGAVLMQPVPRTSPRV